MRTKIAAVALVGFALVGCKGLFKLSATGDPFNPTFRFEEKVYLPKGTILVEKLDAEKHVWRNVWKVSFTNRSEWISEFVYGATISTMDFTIEKDPELLEGNVVYRVGIRGIRDGGVGAFCIKNEKGVYVLRNVGPFQLKQEEIDVCVNAMPVQLP